MNLKMSDPLMQRLLVGSICTAVIIFVIIFSYAPVLSFAVPLITALTVGQALKEYYQIATVKGFDPKHKPGVVLSVAYILVLWVALRTHAPSDNLLFILLALVLLSTFLAFFASGKDPFANSAITLFGIAYLTVPIGCIIQINYFFPDLAEQDGRFWLIYLLFVAYLTDSFALFIGKAIGKNKFAPFISPNKTWEGAIGGFLFAIAFSLLFAFFANQGDSFLPIRLSYFESVVLGAVVSILAQIGDLSESLLKRDAGVKDSSKIPGLGGVLDVIDSLVFTAPFLYLYLKYANH